MEKTSRTPESSIDNLSPEVLKKNYEQKRINTDEGFAGLYSTYKDDMERAANLKESFDRQTGQDELGFYGEALIFSCIERGALGTTITARGTNLYDDLFHGADIVIESKAKQQRDPIVSSIDVTLSQQAPGSSNTSKFENNENGNIVGLEKKLERVKKHLDYIARYPREKAVEISAWLQSGGLSQARKQSNEKYFEEAEKLMLLKYYKNPTTSEDPNKPHFILAGPQVVLSVDRSFVNKSLQANQKDKAIKDIDTLIQAEVPFGVAIITQYLDGLAKELSLHGQAPNLFFDMTRAACRAWELTFATEQNQLRLEKAIQVCLKDPDLKKQIMYYQATLHKAFQN